MKSICQRDIHTSTFIAALVMIAEIWNQPKWPSTNEWIKKMRTYREILFSFKSEANSAICDNIGRHYGK
jgi:hypothetical protein